MTTLAPCFDYVPHASRPSAPSPPPTSESDPFSPAPSTSPKTAKSNASRDKRRSRPYRRRVPPRNFQCEDAALLAYDGSDFRCPVPVCDHVQNNRSVSELKRHIDTHRRSMEPEKWTCRRVGIDGAHLHGIRIRQGMTEEEFVEAGWYMFEGRLMIGGCLNTFSRKDALKRHLGNHSCIGHMTSFHP